MAISDDAKSDRQEIGEDKLTDKITALKLISMDLYRLLTGWKPLGKGGTWVYTGDAVVGESSAREIISKIHSISSDINLISDNEDIDLHTQKFYNLSAVISGMVLDPYNDEKPRESIIIFKNAFDRVMSVIKSSKNYFKNYFGNDKDEVIKESGLI